MLLFLCFLGGFFVVFLRGGYFLLFFKYIFVTFRRSCKDSFQPNRATNICIAFSRVIVAFQISYSAFRVLKRRLVICERVITFWRPFFYHKSCTEWYLWRDGACVSDMPKKLFSLYIFVSLTLNRPRYLSSPLSLYLSISRSPLAHSLVIVQSLPPHFFELLSLPVILSAYFISNIILV